MKKYKIRKLSIAYFVIETVKIVIVMLVMLMFCIDWGTLIIGK